MFKYYNILGVAPDATITDIKKAYREKVKQLHPDINQAHDAHEKFVELREAFDRIVSRDTNQSLYQQRTAAHKHSYRRGSFHSFYYRRYNYKQRHHDRSKDIKLPLWLNWFFHVFFFLVGIGIIVNSIHSFTVLEVPAQLETLEYLAMLVLTFIFGLVLTGATILSAYYSRS